MFYIPLTQRLINKKNTHLRTARKENMHKRKMMLISILTVAMIFSVIAVASASGTTPKYYRLYCPQTDVGIYSDVTITAKTNDGRVDTVTFYWYSLEGKEFQDPPIDVVEIESGVWAASSTHKVDVLGYWTVYAVFKGGSGFWWCDGVWKLKCCHFNVIPEVPLLGSVGASAAMVLGLAAFKLKRKPKK